MEKVEVGVLGRVVNANIIQLPGRHYPSIVLQGDTLWGLYDGLWLIKKLLEDNDIVAAQEVVSELFPRMSHFMAVYDAALNAHGIERPYRLRPEQTLQNSMHSKERPA